MNKYIVQDGEFMLVEPIKIKILPEEIVEELNDVIEQRNELYKENLNLNSQLERMKIELENAKFELNLRRSKNV